MHFFIFHKSKFSLLYLTVNCDLYDVLLLRRQQYFASWRVGQHCLNIIRCTFNIGNNQPHQLILIKNIDD